MLVLTREVGEKIVINIPAPFHGRIEVTVVRITKGKVRLGVEAPAEVEINRREIQDRIDGGEERRSA